MQQPGREEEHEEQRESGQVPAERDVVHRPARLGEDDAGHTGEHERLQRIDLTITEQLDTEHGGDDGNRSNGG